MKQKLFPNGATAIPIILTLMLIGAGSGLGQSFSKSFSPPTIGPGASSVLQFNLTGGEVPLADLNFMDNLPAGVTIAGAPGISNGCGGTVNAPAGGTSISLAGGLLGVGASCSISVNVTSSTVGTHANLTVNLLSGATVVASSDSVELTVATDRPGFSKSFSPSSVLFGGRSTLTFVIGNSGVSAVSGLNFTDPLPASIQIASPLVANSNCPGVLSAVPGSGLISFSGTGVLNAGDTCSIAVDVLGQSTGVLENVSGELNSGFPFKSSGRATASLTVSVPDRIVLNKEFIDDPAPPGGTVTLRFTIRNLDRSATASDIAFDDDLDAVLSGLVATGLPASNVCGLGSDLSGTGVISFSGGTLEPEAICTFDVLLAVPAAATPGNYTNTTTAVTADLEGTPASGDMASDILVVSPVPLLTKTFDPVVAVAGGTVTLEFSITNTSPVHPATDLAFSDHFNEVFTDANSLPSAGFCGPSSTATFSPLNPNSFDPLARLTVSGASLDPGGSCIFSIVLEISPDAVDSVIDNTTSEITGVVDTSPVTGPPASDSLGIAAGPRLKKEFLNDPVVAGGTVDLEFTLSLSADAPFPVTEIEFMDDLDAALTGLVATGLPQNDVCGTGSSLSGAATISLSGGSLAAGDSCSFVVTLQVPAGVMPGSYTNTTSNVMSTILTLDAVSSPASDDLLIAGLELQKEFIDDPVLAGGTVTLRFTINNLNVDEDASAISFTDDLNAALSGLAATSPLPSEPCGVGSQLVGSAGDTFLTFSNGSLVAGSSCTFDVTLLVPISAVGGEYLNRATGFQGEFSATLLQFSDATDLLSVADDFLTLTKEFIDDPVAPGGNVTLEFTIHNNSPSAAATDLSFTDDLEAALAGLANGGGTLLDICGIGSMLEGTDLLTFSGGNLPAGGECTFDVLLSVDAGTPLATVALNTTSEITGMVGGVGVVGEPASDSLQIDYALLSKSFSGPGLGGGQVTLSFQIRNFSAVSISDVSFSDDLSVVLPGLVATGLPASDVCGLGSQLTGTDMLSLTGASLPAGASCTINVVLDIPSGAAPDDYLNTTSPLFQSDLEIGEPASATFTLLPDPDADADGVPDVDDACLGTHIPELTVPSERLGTNRFALVDADLIFDTNKPKGNGPDVVFTTTDTAGCSCEQIIEALALGSGHVKYGCSKGAMEEWIELVSPLQPKAVVPWKQRGRGGNPPRRP